METTYRYRLLIYLAAFMLVMSVCFVYAEPMPSQPHLLFQVAPQHAGFLATSTVEPTFNPDALRTAIAPVLSPLVLQQVQEASRHRSFLHHAKHAAAPVGVQNESSALGLRTAPLSALSTP